MLCIYTKRHENISKGVRTLKADTVFIANFTKGHNFIKMYVEIHVWHILYTLSDEDIYLYQVSRKHLRVSELSSRHDLDIFSLVCHSLVFLSFSRRLFNIN